jgi:hypothetical protein
MMPPNRYGQGTMTITTHSDDDSGNVCGHGIPQLAAFIDAVVAFVASQRMIAADRIPGSVAALLQALNAAGFARLAMFRYSHVRWAGRRGREASHG